MLAFSFLRHDLGHSFFDVEYCGKKDAAVVVDTHGRRLRLVSIPHFDHCDDEYHCRQDEPHSICEVFQDIEGQFCITTFRLEMSSL